MMCVYEGTLFNTTLQGLYGNDTIREVRPRRMTNITQSKCFANYGILILYIFLN